MGGEGADCTLFVLSLDSAPIPSLPPQSLPASCTALWAIPLAVPPTPHCGRLVILTIPLNPPSSSWRKVLVICISILQMKKVEAQRDDLICPKSRHWQWTSGLSESKGQASPLIPTCLSLLGPQPDSQAGPQLGSETMPHVSTFQRFLPPGAFRLP